MLWKRPIPGPYIPPTPPLLTTVSNHFYMYKILLREYFFSQ